jgi:hypothetical protein
MPISRRHFLQAGTALGVASVSMQASAIDGFGTGRPVCAVVDPRLPASIVFGALAEARGAEVLKIGHDLSDVWLAVMRHIESGARPALLGLTRESTLFCLEIMGRPGGMRVVLRDELDRRAAATNVSMAARAAHRAVTKSPQLQPARFGSSIDVSGADPDAPLIAWALAQAASR